VVLPPTAVPRHFRIGFILSRASPLLKSSPTRTRQVPFGPGNLPWGFVPLRDVSLRSPHTRASQARSVPSSAFLTSSTAYSSAGLVGLFHPTAASGVCPTGVSLQRSRTTSSVAVALVPFLRTRLPRLAPWRQRTRPVFRALLRAGVRHAAKAVSFRTARSPPGLLLLRVLRSPTVPPPSRQLRS